MKAHILFLESFYGGSHRDFADGFAESSRHSIDFITLPAKFWKWRMRGAALSFYETIPDPRKYDLIFVTDLIGLADLVALWPAPRPPIILYMHENQLSYPVPKGTRIDYQFGFSNITSALAADHLVFNSHFHMYSFLDALPDFLASFPEFKPLWVIDELKKKGRVLYPGCRFDPTAPVAENKAHKRPIVVWNHRWEFDKKPDEFFSAINEVDDAGVDFDLVIMGESFQKVPRPFAAAKERYGMRLLTYGYVESREDYYRWLAKGDVIVSTAIQENYGIAVIEAIRMGCFPLLPERLAYPEILPELYHNDCLYKSPEDLIIKLKSALTQPLPDSSESLSEAMGCYAWKNIIDDYDALIESAIQAG
jgi:glycosyltransferase involved in cell wall biosynthesis